MSDENKSRLVPVELVEDSGGDDSNENQFPEIDYDFFVDTVKTWNGASAKWFSMHFNVPESKIQKFCMHHWKTNFTEVKVFLRGYIEIWASKHQLKEIQAGNSGMLMFWGQAHLGQGKNARPQEQEAKPIPLAYVPKSQRNKGE